ncbi:MAG: cobalt ECF transporter T component CbiQ [Lachnospiraceae bacterium]|nr:cobalt ECF transporter T component CbiQ [Lachnospiraceae bacterium]
MNKMQKAIRELSEMDELAARSSPIHALHPAAKLIATIAYILVTLSFDKYDLGGLVPMVLWPVFLFQISGTEVKSCFYKLRIVLPLVMAVGLFNPFFDKTILLRIGGISVSGGVISMLTLMLKGLFCLMASFLLMATTSIDSLCAALRKLHVPKMLVTLLLLTYRYVGVMTEELAVMTDAYHLRAPGQKGIHISAWGSFLGQLLLRSMDRAQELYSSMLLRGYNQQFYYAGSKPFRMRDALYLIVCIAVFVLLRMFRIAELLGGAIVR